VKVAFVLGTSTGGTARHVRMLAAGCAERGVSAEVFGPARTDRDFAFSAIAGGQVAFTPVEIADRPRVRHDLRAIRRLRRLIAAWRPDVVHAHGLRAGALSAIALAFIRPTVYDPRPALVVTVHNAPAAGGLTGAVYRVLERIVAHSADSVLCVSADLEERMRAAGARRVGHAPVPPAAVPTPGSSQAGSSQAGSSQAGSSQDGSSQDGISVAGISAADLSAADLSAAGISSAGISALGISAADVSAADVSAADVSAETRAARPLPGASAPDRPMVLAVGRLAPQKGFGTLLEAAARWRDIEPEPLLVIAGEGPLEAELKARAAALRVDVRFPGHRDDVHALLAAAAVFVLPSTWEGQPLILQEALRAGVPIVATRVGGTPELTGEDAALLVPVGDASRLAGAVRSVLTDPALAGRLRQAAADRWRDLPDEDDAISAALAEYNYVTRTPKPR
jgi:glycosyltransferase involved in cell wall biosynthesis